MEKDYKLVLNLQQFADTGEPNADAGESADKEEASNEPDKKSGKVEFTPEQQAHIDAMFNKRFADLQKDKDEAVKEAEKLAKMNTAQQNEYKLKQLEAKNQEYEKALNLVQMSRIASSMLTEHNIAPTEELLNVVTRETAEETDKLVKSFLSVVDSEVERQVNAKLRIDAPTLAGGYSDGFMSLDEIQEKYQNDPEKRIALIRKYHTN